MQGDILDGCPVPACRGPITIDRSSDSPDSVRAALRGSVGVEFTRVIVMTQACDLANDPPVPYVILCPAQTLEEFRSAWVDERKGNGKPHGKGEWKGAARHLRRGHTWELALLKPGKAEDGDLSTAALVVHFQEIFSLPYQFLSGWVQQGPPRLQLQPPYREHLSQSFARYFMRVGLPTDLTDEDAGI